MILLENRQTIPIVCIVHFIITQYPRYSKQKFSIVIQPNGKNGLFPKENRPFFIFYAMKTSTILMHIIKVNATTPPLVKKHFRHRRSIHSPLR